MTCDDGSCSTCALCVSSVLIHGTQWAVDAKKNKTKHHDSIISEEHPSSLCTEAPAKELYFFLILLIDIV